MTPLAAQSVEELNRLAHAHRKQRHLPDAGNGPQALQPVHAPPAAVQSAHSPMNEEDHTQLVANLLPEGAVIEFVRGIKLPNTDFDLFPHLPHQRR